MFGQQHSIQKIVVRAALAFLRKAMHIAVAARPVMTRIGTLLGWVISRVLLLPLYRLAMSMKLRGHRLMLPARGMVVLLLTNRYLLHVVVMSVAIGTIAVNLTVRQANAQDAGRGSLLYAMVTGDEARMTEQEVHPDQFVRDSHYAGPASLLALQDIDFDYDDAMDGDITAVSVPGTIVAVPEPTLPDETGAHAEPRTNTETYVVQEGDTLSGIAQQFNINVGTILWANSRTEFQYLRPGDALRIPPTSGVLVTIKKNDTLLSLANKYGSSVEEIVRANRLVPDEILPLGVELVLPGGQPPAAPIAVRVPVRPREPVPTTSGPKPANADASTATGKLLWPTSGHVITQYYGWRHTGVDIDGDYASPIYASHDGTVTTASWNSGGYGMQIVLTSADGVRTRYAHASKMFVKQGDTVKKGEVIAMVGTTGRSTGTHLHYEVYIGGRRTNPLSSIR